VSFVLALSLACGVGIVAAQDLDPSGGTYKPPPSQRRRPKKPVTRPTTHPLPVPRDGQLAAAGDRAVLLDAEKHRLLRDDGSTVSLPGSVTADAKLQQSGADAGEVAIATDSGVVVVAADGGTRTISADLARPVTSSSQISAPVVVDNCIHAAWAGAQRYLLACDGQNPRTVDIEQKTQGSTLEFLSSLAGWPPNAQIPGTDRFGSGEWS